MNGTANAAGFIEGEIASANERGVKLRVHEIARFWALVDRPEHGCWEWRAARMSSGYGCFRLSTVRRQMLAHRFAFQITNGAIPIGMVVCHRCDNPPCVRPDHLFMGTQAENLADMKRKGRSHRAGSPGEQHPRARLTNADVRSIRLNSTGADRRTLAARYGVTPENIHAVQVGKTWKHLLGEGV